jgi:hypothetical protein
VATRAIVTSQPDVECDVCARRLLRGEQPEVFLAAGDRRTVCELCAPRATHEGWQRETGDQAVNLPPLRPRRGRNLFERLRLLGRPAPAPARARAASPAEGGEAAQYEFLDGRSAAEDADPPEQPDRAGGERPAGPSAGARVGGRAEQAIEVFNASEHPRRVAGVARSLGVPGVSVRPDEDLRNLVSIVVAWELCWYRYGVDLDADAAEATVLAQGTELDELAREERHVNAAADELGALCLTGT